MCVCVCVCVCERERIKRVDVIWTPFFNFQKSRHARAELRHHSPHIMSSSASDKLSPKDRESLAKDYAQLSRLLQKFDQEVATFVQTTEGYTQQTAPACAALTELWSHHHQQQQGDGAVEVDHTTNISSEDNDTSKHRAKGSHKKRAASLKMDTSSSNDDPLIFIQR